MTRGQQRYRGPTSRTLKLPPKGHRQQSRACWVGLRDAAGGSCGHCWGCGPSASRPRTSGPRPAAAWTATPAAREAPRRSRPSPGGTTRSGLPCSRRAAPAGSCSPACTKSVRAGGPRTTKPVRPCAPAARAPPFVLATAPGPPTPPPAPTPAARRPAPRARPRLPMSMAKRLAFSRLRKISSGGSVMLLSRLSPLLPLPLTPHSAILNVPGQPHQPWRYMRIYLTDKRLPRIDYANEEPWPAPPRPPTWSGRLEDSGPPGKEPNAKPLRCCLSLCTVSLFLRGAGQVLTSSALR